MIIVGTAGHIDHGKSAIVKRLTGTDPDRLPEEKSRGMTIDLGFAFYQTDKNETIAFVDVPGHERFVKNMIAGAGGIDVVMMVVAADDGWMPQSEEHFQILRLLNIKHGIIVVNKIDLAEKDWLDLLTQDIYEKVKSTFLEKAPLFKISAQTGEGFDELAEYLNQLPENIQQQKDIGKPRLYIDRSFVRPGIGGVVTGTLRGGNISIGETVGIWPAMEEARIRTLHSNNQDVETASPGQRTAVSFTGIEKEKLNRGGVIVSKDMMSGLADNQVFALSFELLKDTKISLTDRRRILFIIGTTEIEGEIRLYEQKSVQPSVKTILFFKPDEPVYTMIGDRFIARLPTPMVTIGGGVVVDHLNHFPRRKELQKQDYLKLRLNPNLENLITSELVKTGIRAPENLLRYSNFSKDAISQKLKNMWQSKTLKIFEGCFYHVVSFEETIAAFLNHLKSYLEINPHLKGLLSEQIAAITGWDNEQNSLMIKFLVSDGRLVKFNELYNLSGRTMALKGAVKKAYDEIMESLNEKPYAPPALSKIAHKGKQYKDAVKFIIDSRVGYKCGSEFLFLIEVWEEILIFIKESLNKKNEIKVADLRGRFEFSRKYVIPILEETDRIKLTRRDGDVRRKGADFEAEEFNI